MIARLAPIILLCLVSVLSAADPAPSVATIRDVSGETHTGPIESLTSDSVTIGGESAHTFAADDLIEIRLSERAAGPFRGGAVLLANGDRLLTTPERIEDEQLIARWNDFEAAALSIPLETIRGIALALPEMPSRQDSLLKQLRDHADPHDAALLMNGETVNGELTGLGDAITLETSVGDAELPRADVRAIAMNPELISFPTAEGPTVLIELADGSSVTAKDVRLVEGGALAVQALFGAEFEMPVSQVASLRFLGRRAVYLSDIEAAEYIPRPYLSLEQPLAQDRNVLGGALRLRGKEHRKGLGVQSAARIRYALDGAYDSFHSTIGIDDAARGGGSVVFAVEVDGERVFDSDTITGSSDPLPVGPIDLKGKREIVLIVDYGERGDVLDYANWCDALIVKSAAAP